MNWVMLRAVSGFISSALSTASLQFINVSTYIVLYNLSPVFLMIFSTTMFGEKLSCSNIVSLISSFLGTIFVIQPSILFAGEGVDTIGTTMAITSSLFLAIAYIIVA